MLAVERIQTSLNKIIMYPNDSISSFYVRKPFLTVLILFVIMCLIGALYACHPLGGHDSTSKSVATVSADDSLAKSKTFAQSYADLPGYTIDGRDMSLFSVWNALFEQGHGAMYYHIDAETCADSNNFHRLTLHLFKRPLQEIVDSIFAQEPSLYYTYDTRYHIYSIRLIRLKGKW